MDLQKAKARQQQRRRWHVRNRIRLQSNRLRLSVCRSNKHISVQIIDDEAGKTLAAASSLQPAVRGDLKHGANIKAAKLVGKKIAELAKEKGIEEVAFDRGHFKYHGRIKALADAAREAGLKF